MIESTRGAVAVKDLKPPEEGHIQIITLDDGSNVNGKITNVTGTEVTFESSVGTMTIPIPRIKEIREVPANRIRGGDYWFTNPNQTRMYIGPTGRMLKKRSGYFTDFWLFFPAAAYGITDNITIGGGMSLFPGVDFDEQLYYLTPKIGIEAAERLSLAVSGLIIFIPDWSDEVIDEPSTLGAILGVGTYGTEDKSVTFGLGYGYIDDDFADKPVVTIGGEYRFARRISFVTENWVIPNVDPPLLSYGVRFFGEDIAVDLAFLNVASEDAIFPGFPLLGFVYNF
jgi:hypothetical protein